MKILESAIIYENPLPRLKSRQSFFPFLCRCKDGSLAAIHVIGEAFESVDSTSCISFSHDGGKTWSKRSFGSRLLPWSRITRWRKSSRF